MISRLRQLSEPRLRQQAGIEKSQIPVERDILVQWVRNTCIFYFYLHFQSMLSQTQTLGPKIYFDVSVVWDGF